MFDADRREHALLPEAAASIVGRERIYEAHRQDAFDWARYNAESESFRMIFVPCLYVECQERGKLDGDGLPGLPEVHGGAEDNDFEGGIDSVNACLWLACSLY